MRTIEIAGRTYDACVYEVPTVTRFRGLASRSGVLLRGAVSWAEWSPFLEYGPREAATWLRAAVQYADSKYGKPVRDRVPVNCTIPAVGPSQAADIAARSGCQTAKIKVAEPGQTLADDVARVSAVRDALGADAKIRVDANGAWDVETAAHALAKLGPLEYAEQPCADVTELAELRRRLLRAGVSVPIAADESIRKTGDPQRVAQLEAADVAVLKVQPLGGVGACLCLADELGLPVVVSSALETSIGIGQGLALAARLPTLEHACGLNTVPLLAADVVTESLVAVGGAITPGRPLADPTRVTADDALAERWWQRLDEVSRLLDRG